MQRQLGQPKESKENFVIRNEETSSLNFLKIIVICVLESSLNLNLVKLYHYLAKLFAHQHHCQEVAATSTEFRICLDAHQPVLEKLLNNSIVELVIVVHFSDERKNLFLRQFGNCLNKEKHKN